MELLFFSWQLLQSCLICDFPTGLEGSSARVLSKYGSVMGMQDLRRDVTGLWNFRREWKCRAMFLLLVLSIIHSELWSESSFMISSVFV